MGTGENFDMKLLSEAEIVRRRRLGRWALAIFMCVLAIALWKVPKPAGLMTPVLVDDFMRFMAWGVSVVIFADGGLRLLGIEPESLGWLHETYCGELATLCEENEGLRVYRDRVRAQARRFTLGEFRAMKAWARESRIAKAEAAAKAIRSADCKRLYGIADQS
ncbi:hypothetical protein AB4Y45_33450 [Paraburkholderia sp. EG287A]|uniref:hypothetical protein n=1 Tax=Paraburkholderia sp. EG287A TaxID=3237012 RepID=UPI0034D28D31